MPEPKSKANCTEIVSVPLSGRVFCLCFSPSSTAEQAVLGLGLRHSVVILQINFAQNNQAQIIKEVS